jgi:uncharacterized membrane protein
MVKTTQKEQTSVNVGATERWVSLLAGTALLGYGLTRDAAAKWLLSTAGILLAVRGIFGRSPLYRMRGIDRAQPTASRDIDITRAVTVNRSPEDAYAFWRNLENLPRFMQNLASVRTMGDNRSHWILRIPGNATVEWDAELTAERPNELLAWRTLADADVEHSGRVEFAPAPGQRGTEVKMSVQYRPPGGRMGKPFARLLNAVTAQQVKEDLRRFKQIVEAGEIATTAGQPSGRRATPAGG